MWISNYGDLKNELKEYLFNNRFAARYDNYTKMFEADANSRLRMRQMEFTDVFVVTNGLWPLPPDYLLWRSVLWIRGGVATPPVSPPYRDVTEMDYVHPAYLHADVIDRSYGRPTVFTIEGTQFRARIPTTGSDAYEFHYYAKIPTLIGSDLNSNWLLSEYPNAYLFGLMMEAAGQGRNVEMAQLYKARRDEVFQEIIQLSALTTGATSPKVRVGEYF